MTAARSDDNKNPFSELGELLDRLIPMLAKVMVATQDNPKSDKPENQQRQSHNGCECCQNRARERHWSRYNNKRNRMIAGPLTDVLFGNLSPNITQAFHDSTLPIIDLGVSTGDQHTDALKKKRVVIGYDNSDAALATLKQKGIILRNVDLSKLTEEELSYRETLREDLVSPSDIFMVHILEYLPRKTAICLIYELMKSAKPGSTFYIQTYIDFGPVDNRVDFITLDRYGYFASFFGARTDMQILQHKQGVIKNYENSPLEQLVVRKYK